MQDDYPDVGDSTARCFVSGQYTQRQFLSCVCTFVFLGDPALNLAVDMSPLCLLTILAVEDFSGIYRCLSYDPTSERSGEEEQQGSIMAMELAVKWFTQKQLREYEDRRGWMGLGMV